MHFVDCTPDKCCGAPDGGNSWSNYSTNYGIRWDDLLLGPKQAWANLGWDRESWNYWTLELSFSWGHGIAFCWENGSRTQLRAVASLCYTKESWNEKMARLYDLTCGMYK